MTIIFQRTVQELNLAEFDFLNTQFLYLFLEFRFEYFDNQTIEKTI